MENNLTVKAKAKEIILDIQDLATTHGLAFSDAMRCYQMADSDKSGSASFVKPLIEKMNEFIQTLIDERRAYQQFHGNPD